jgi:dolichol-phosphate mannosyltransferase
MPFISAVVPVYKCNECLYELCRRLDLALSEIDEEYEIVLINDASPDNAWDTIKDLAAKDRRVKGVNLSRNFGQHCAITAGLDHAKGDWVVVMDCDLQDQPEEILRFYKKALEGYDIVLGRREERRDGAIKKLFSLFFYKVLSYLTDTHQDAAIANFGIYHKKVIGTIRSMRENLRYFPVMVQWVGFNTATINIVHAKRVMGKTSYSFRKLFNMAVDVMIAFSDKPLRLTIKLGIIISSLSFLYAAYIAVRALLGLRGYEGWPTIVVSIWFFSGLIILILGILGLYIGKTFDETKKRPIYIVKDTVND